jgi:hypothetical protein
MFPGKAGAYPSVFHVFWTNVFPTNVFRTNVFWTNVFWTNVFWTNAFQSNAFQSNVFWTNVFWLNAFQTNVFRTNVFRPNVFRPIFFEEKRLRRIYDFENISPFLQLFPKIASKAEFQVDNVNRIKLFFSAPRGLYCKTFYGRNLRIFVIS